MIHQLHQSQIVPADLDSVFAFFSHPSNLEALTPPALRFTIITPPPVLIEKGAIIDYSLRIHGIPVRWTTLIAAYVPPHHFVDLQLRGPYSFWHHTHRFEATPEGTRIEDEVHYALPFGPLGRVVHTLFVRRDLQRIFSFRREIIANHFGKCE